MNRVIPKSYLFYDAITQAYLAVVGIFILLGNGDRMPPKPWLLAAHGLGMVCLHVLIIRGSRPEAWSWLRLLRRFYPIFLFALFYRESEALNRIFIGDYLDPAVVRLEQWIFGFQPSLAFMDRLPWLVVSESFYAAYFSFYLMIGGMALYLFLSNRKQYDHFLSVICLVFYGCYLCFFFLPIIGPRLFSGEVAGYVLPPEWMPQPPASFPSAIQSGPFHQLMTLIFYHLEGAGGSVPSSHVAVSLATVWFSYLYVRKIRHVHLVIVIWLCLATVYCRYHYALDVLTGLAAAIILIPLGHWGHHTFLKHNEHS